MLLRNADYTQKLGRSDILQGQKVGMNRHVMPPVKPDGSWDACPVISEVVLTLPSGDWTVKIRAAEITDN